MTKPEMLLIFVPFFFSKTFRKTNILYLMFFFCLFQKFNIFIGEFSLQTKPVLLSEDSLEKVQTKPVLLSEDRRLPGKSSNKASFVVRRQKTPWKKFKRSQYCCQKTEDSLEKVQTKPVLLSEDRRLPGESSNEASIVVKSLSYALSSILNTAASLCNNVRGRASRHWGEPNDYVLVFLSWKYSHCAQSYPTLSTHKQYNDWIGQAVTVKQTYCTNIDGIDDLWIRQYFRF